MLRTWLAVSVLAIAWGFSANHAAAQHERPYEFQGVHVALSIERFMGVDYTDFEGPGKGEVHGRFLLNASEPVPTVLGRFGVDVFIHRFSVGVAGGVTDNNVGVFNPRVGYLFGLTPEIGLWLRGGAFYAAAGPHYVGIDGEVLLAWFPFPRFAMHVGPTIDLAFANDPHPNYVSFGILEFGMSAFL